MGRNQLRGSGKHGAQERSRNGNADATPRGIPVSTDRLKDLPRLIRRQAKPSEHRALQELKIKIHIEMLDQDLHYTRALHALVDSQIGAVGL